MKLYFARRIHDLSSLRFLALVVVAIVIAAPSQPASAQTQTAYTNAPLIGVATPAELQRLHTSYLRHAIQPRVEDIMPGFADPSVRPASGAKAIRVAEDAPVAPTASVVASTEQTVDATLINGLASGYTNGAADEYQWYTLGVTTGLPTTTTPINTDVIWSHNESFLIFSSNITGYYQLYAMSSSGGPIAFDSHSNAIYVEQLTGLTVATETTDVRYPSLLGPNDSSIAYCADTDGNGVYQLYISPFTNAGSGYTVDQAPADITPLASQYIARHPFYIGNEIYFSGKAHITDSYNIYSVAIATGIVTQITGPTAAAGYDNDNPNVSAFGQLAWDSTASAFTYTPQAVTPNTVLTASSIVPNSHRNIWAYTPGLGVQTLTTQSATYDNEHPVWSTSNSNDFFGGTNNLFLFFDSNRVSAYPPGNALSGHSIYYFRAYTQVALAGSNAPQTTTTAAVPAWVTGSPTQIPVASTTGFTVGDDLQFSDNLDYGLVILGIISTNTEQALLVDNASAHASGVTVTDISTDQLQLRTEAQAGVHQVNTSDPSHQFDDEQVSVSSLVSPYVSVAYISNRYLLDSISDNPLDVSELTNQNTELTAEGLSANYLPSDVEPESVAINNGATPGSEVLISRLQVLGPPSLIRFNESDSEVVHVYPGDLSSYTASLGTTLDPTTTHYVPAGQDATFVVRLSERQVGIGQAWLQIKDPEGAFQDTTGLEHKVFTEQWSAQFHPNPQGNQEAYNEATNLWSGGAVAGFDGANAIQVGNQVQLLTGSSFVNGYCSLLVAAGAGTSTLTVSSVSGFAIGDTISVNYNNSDTAGGLNEPTATISNINTVANANGTNTYIITLTAPLEKSHIVGEPIADLTDMGTPAQVGPPVVAAVPGSYPENTPQSTTSTEPLAGTTTFYVTNLNGIAFDTPEAAVFNPGGGDAEVVWITGWAYPNGTTPASITISSGSIYNHPFGEPIDVISSNDNPRDGITSISANEPLTGNQVNYVLDVTPGTGANFAVGDIVGILNQNYQGGLSVSPVNTGTYQEAEITSVTANTLTIDKAILEAPATHDAQFGLSALNQGEIVFRIAKTAFDPMGQEIDCQAIDTSLNANSGNQDVISALPQSYFSPLYTPGYDDDYSFGTESPYTQTTIAPPLDPNGGSIWLQLEPMPQADQDKNGGVLYYATWNTPLDVSDYYIDVIPEDASTSENWRVYDNVWGFTTQTFQPTNSILIVNDYALPQKFFNGNIEDNGPGQARYGVESYWTDINNNIAAWQSYYGAPNNTLSTVDQLKAPTVVLPLVAQENGERAKILWEYDETDAGNGGTSPNYFPAYGNGLGVNSYFDENMIGTTTEGTGGETTTLANSQKYDIWRILSRGAVPQSVIKAYTPTTVQSPVDPYNPTGPISTVVAPSCVIWLSPYPGNNYVGPGTITDSATQSLLDSFLKAGGRLHLEGASIGYALTNDGANTSSFYDNDLNDNYIPGGGNLSAFRADYIGPATANFQLTATNGGRISTDAYLGSEHAWDEGGSFLYPSNFTGGIPNYAPPSSEPLTIAHFTILVNGTDTRSDASLYCDNGFMDDFLSDATTQFIGAGGNQEVFYTSNAAPGQSYFGSEVSYCSFGIATISQEVEAFNGAGYQSANAYVTVNQRTNLIHNLICAMRTGTLTGLVTTSGEAAQPVTLATVVATSNTTGIAYTGTTNGAGSYTIKGVPAGAYSVRAYKEGYSFQHNAGTGTLTHGGDSGNVNLTLSLAGNGSLQVYVVSGSPTAKLTAAAGAGTTSLAVNTTLGFSVGQTIVLDAGNSNFEAVQITAVNPTGLTLTTTTLTNSHVSGANVQMPLLNAGVTPSEIEGGIAPVEQFTPANGLVTFPAIPTGAYTMTASLLGYQTVADSITVTQGVNPAIVLVLDPLTLNISGLVYAAGSTASSTLSAAVVAGATSLPVASVAGFGVNQTAEIDAGTAESEYVTISGLVATPPSLTVSAIANAHASGAAVSAVTPISGATITLTNSLGTALISATGTIVTATTGANGVYEFSVPGADFPVGTPIYVSGAAPLYISSVAITIATPPGTVNATQTYVDINIPLSLVPTPAPTPVITPPSEATLTNPLPVSINDAGCTIYYTTDGNTPVVGNADTLQYTSTFNVTGTTVTVEAIGLKAGDSQSAVASVTYTIGQTVPSLTISPAPGAYTTKQTVTLSDSLAGVSIYYTTDGSIPTLNGGLPTGTTTQYSTPFSVGITGPSGETINAIAAESGYSNSPVLSATYIIGQTVATPTISPTAGPYVSAQTITITDPGFPGATIYYTTNGTSPSVNSTRYTGGILVTGNETISAIAVETGYFNSGIAVSQFIIDQTVPTPTFSPNGGPYTSPVSVTISDSLPGASILYSTDGVNYSPYSTPVLVNGPTTTLYAKATESGYNPSAAVSVVFTIGATVPAPVITPAGGPFVNAQTVSITDSQSGTAIYYTTDGTTPTLSSTLYSGPFTVASSETITAVGIQGGYFNSPATVATFTIGQTLPPPTFNPVGGPYTSAVAVSLNDAIATASIYYTTNGTAPVVTAGVPGPNTSLYTGAPIPESANGTIEAIAVQTGSYNPSTAAIASYTIGQTIPNPTISPNGGTYTTTQTVTLTDGQAGSSIYFTLDGTTPDSTISSELYGSTKLTGPITVGTKTLPVSSVGGFSAGESVLIDGSNPAIAETAVVQSVTNAPTPSITLTVGVLNAHALGAAVVEQIKAATSETIDAYAVETGYLSSSVVTANFTIGQTVSIPTFSSPGGAYSTAQNITLSDATSGAAIYYTTDGSTPGLTNLGALSGTTSEYSGPIPVSASETITAIGIKAGYFNSPLATGTYIIGQSLPPPTFSPNGGPATTSETVTLSDANAGASIYYSTDGSTPSSTSPTSNLYTSPITVSTSGTTTVKAIAVESGYISSLASSATFTIGVTLPAPGITPAAGAYASAQSVTLTSTNGAAIYYTLDGSTPTTSSHQYTGAFQVASSETVSAIAAEAGYYSSPVTTAAYIIGQTVPTPTITPNGGNSTTAETVTFADTLGGSVTYYYTTDGATPTFTALGAVTGSTQIYSGPLTVSSSETVKVIAAEAGYINSGVASATFTIGTTVPVPAFTPGAETSASSVLVTISDALAGTTIYYTTDGSTPTTSSAPYTAPISVSATTTINAIAVETGYTTSPTATALYTITAQPIATYSAGLQLFSLPETYTGVGIDSIFGYSGVKLAVWLPLESVYALTPTSPANSVVAGQGYWVRFPQAVTVALPGTPTPTNAPFVIHLQAGWNQIGDPFTSTVSLSSTSFNSGTETYAAASAGTSPLVGNTMYAYDSGSNAYVAATSLALGQGYWMFAYSATDMEIPAP